MAWKGGFDRSFSASEFREYVGTLVWNRWRPSSITIHHTGAPSLAQWLATPVPGNPNPTMLQREKTRMVNLEHYYKNQQKWSSGPHLFIGERIWLGTPLTMAGTHAVSFNATSIGIEIAGNYDVEHLDGLVRENSIAALAILHEALGLEPETIKFHRDDPRTTKTCPGRNIKKSDIIRDVQEYMAADNPGEHIDDQDEAEAPRVYTVQRGDTLTKIAKTLDVPVADLIRANGGRESINIGQVLSLAAVADTPPAAPAVKSGSLSRKGAVFIAREEGVVLTTYMDGPTPAIGMGHNDPSLPMGKTITIDEAVALYRQDNVRFDAAIAKAITAPAEQHEWDMFNSLAHNIGAGAFAASSVVRHFNAGDKQAAADAFLLWHKANGKPNMLLARRQRERATFLTGDYGDLSKVPVWTGDPRKTAPVWQAMP
jgi:GH24 family phage-related lysozyme (muramidase)